MNWEREFAAWRQADPDTDGVAQICSQLRTTLSEAGAVAVADVRLQVSTQHLIDDDRSIVLGECRGLVLRHPNPMPQFNLFRRARAA